MCKNKNDLQTKLAYANSQVKYLPGRTEGENNLLAETNQILHQPKKFVKANWTVTWKLK